MPAHAEVPVDSLKASWLVYGEGFVQGPARRVAKRAFDVVSSAVLLVLAAPVMVLATVAIRLDSRGPVFYRQERVGLGGRSFQCVKFRSMAFAAYFVSSALRRSITRRRSRLRMNGL